MKKDIEQVGGSRLLDLSVRFGSLVRIFPSFFLSGAANPRKGTTQARTRKIVAIQDKETKTREVAILDYWSQSALLPLHKYQLRFMKRINQDCTMDQTKHFRWLSANAGDHYWSIDLTAATDRFPIMVQHQFLEV